MTRIDLSTLARELADAPVDAVATVRVQGWAGSAPASTVNGAGVVFSPRNEVIVRGDAPERTVELPPTDGTFCYRWDVSMRSGTLRLATRYTLVPDSDTPVPFGDLVQVLPGSLEPSDGGRAAWDIVRTEAEAAAAAADESARLAAQAVDTPGRQGMSAFEVAQAAGFTGTQAEWLESLRGIDGTDPTPQSYADAINQFDAARDAVLSATREDIASRTSGAGLTLWKRAPARTLTFYDADQTGVADASTAWATALSEVPTGGILSIPEGVFKVPDVSITRSDVAVEGPGLLQGRVTVGQSGLTTDFFGRGFHGVRFARSGPVSDPTFAGIRIRNAKRLRIERCWFYNMSSAVYSESSVGNDVANLNLVGNVYENVGYFFRAVTGAGAVWRSHADINILGNHGKARITHVKIDSVDGLRANNNRMFFYGFAAQDQQKERHFEIGYSDWLNISDNELFEAGLESITLTDPNHFELVENLIAWPSQRANRDAISVTLGVGRSGDATAPARTFSYGKIGGGVISQYSKAAVGFYGTGHVGFVVITPTALERASGNPPTYYGTDTLGTPRRVSVAGSLTAIPPKTPEYNGELSGTMFDDFRGRVTAAERWLHPRAKEIALPSRDATITSKTSLYILRDLNQQSTTTTALSGIIHLDMRNAGTLAKTATYVLLVGTSPDGTRSCQVLGSVGRSAGGAANDPAFTFAVEHNGTNIVLQATPISPTSGAFSYSAVAEGNLTLG